MNTLQSLAPLMSSVISSLVSARVSVICVFFIMGWQVHHKTFQQPSSFHFYRTVSPFYFIMAKICSFSPQRFLLTLFRLFYEISTSLILIMLRILTSFPSFLITVYVYSTTFNLSLDNCTSMSHTNSFPNLIIVDADHIAMSRPIFITTG